MHRLRVQELVAFLALGDRTARMLMKAAAVAKETRGSDLDENAAQRLMKAARLDAAKAKPASVLETAQRLIKSAGANRTLASDLDESGMLKLSRKMWGHKGGGNHLNQGG